MLILNKSQEPNFKILVSNKWTDFELVTNLVYAKEDYWLVKRVGQDEELKLTRSKAEELFNEKKLVLC